MIYLFLFSLFVQAQNDCPKNSLRVEFDSPVTRTKKILCQIKKDGQFVTISELNGEVSPLETPKEVPHKIDTQSISKNLQELLKIISVEQQKSSTEFIVEDCDKNHHEWVKMALTNKARKVSYQFEKNCDVEGEFEAQFGKTFPMKMNLRHLSNYQRTEMNILLSIVPGTQGLELKFEASDSLLQSPKEKIRFKAWYSISINPLTARPFPGTKQGEITILEVNEQKLDMKTKIHYE